MWEGCVADGNLSIFPLCVLSSKQSHCNENVAAIRSLFIEYKSSFYGNGFVLLCVPVKRHWFPSTRHKITKNGLCAFAANSICSIFCSAQPPSHTLRCLFCSSLTPSRTKRAGYQMWRKGAAQQAARLISSELDAKYMRATARTRLDFLLLTQKRRKIVLFLHQQITHRKHGELLRRGSG